MSEKIHKALVNLFMSRQPVQTIIGKITDVNEAEATCSVEPANGTPAYHNVRLRSIVDSGNSGIIPIPENGSFCVMAIIGNRDEDSVIMLIEKLKKYKIMCTDIQLNGDQFNGLVKVDELVQKLNAIENLINQFISVYNAHTHVSSGTPPAVLQTSTSTLTQKSDIENTNVKHG